VFDSQDFIFQGVTMSKKKKVQIDVDSLPKWFLDREDCKKILQNLHEYLLRQLPFLLSDSIVAFVSLPILDRETTQILSTNSSKKMGELLTRKITDGYVVNFIYDNNINAYRGYKFTVEIK
jgi:hypothetical protein